MHTENQFASIAALDLDPIKVKLMHEESGEGWSLARADAVEFEYRRFLYLMKKFPHEAVAPLSDVDTFWHYHILDTMKYAADCDAVFGYFLHHFPYVGLRGDEDREAHHRGGERMRELYEDTFGEDYIRTPDAPQVSRDAGTAWCQGVMTTAWSTYVPPVSPTATAWSTNVPPMAPTQATAWSTNVPPMSTLATTAWSTNVPPMSFNSARPTISRAT